MLSKIISILNHAFNALAGILRWRRRAQATARQQAIEGAVHAGDVDEVTKIHHNLLKVLLLGLLPGSLLTGGCAEPSPRLLIVNQPMVPVRMTHDGTPGWWLSDALYEATLLRLDALKTQHNERN